MGTLLGDVRVALAELTPGAGDPPFETAWEVLVAATHAAGARLLDPEHGPEWYAAAEVRLYLEHLERVSRVSAGSALQAPRLALRALRATARYVEGSTVTDELLQFLVAVPGIAAEFSEFLVRTSGRTSRPVVDVIDLAVRAGAVYQECLARAVPTMPYTRND